ncbi:MAG TPA: phosphotransferase [Thermoanaerobaculia bacterium]|nr:phosphotransferase [Thermoanaerobaculia bacterium]
MDAAAARSLVETRFPSVFPPGAVCDVQGPEHGTSNDCFRLRTAAGGEWIVRFPKSGEAEQELACELLVLPLLERLPVAVPRYELVAAAGDHHPRRFAVYRALPGEPLAPELLAALSEPAVERAAARLGAFLAAVHGVERERLEAAEAAAGVRLPRERLGWLDEGADGARREVEDQLAPFRGHPAFAAVRRSVRELIDGDPEALRSSAGLVHGDLAPEHVLFCRERGEVTGILDFGNLAWDDPAIDFIQLADCYGPGFLARVLAAYDHPGAVLLRRKVDVLHAVARALRAFRAACLQAPGPAAVPDAS